MGNVILLGKFKIHYFHRKWYAGIFEISNSADVEIGMRLASVTPAGEEGKLGYFMAIFNFVINNQ